MEEEEITLTEIGEQEEKVFVHEKIPFPFKIINEAEEAAADLRRKYGD